MNGPFTLPHDQRREIDSRWEKALPYFRKRSPVVFLSYGRFWESHGFVQQSLAKALVDAGIDVHWIDGRGWRPRKPVLYFRSPRLTISQLFEPPGRRIGLVDELSIHLGARQIKKLLAKNPLFWVQDSMEERLAEKIPYVDVFSLFDDLHRHEPSGPLAQKARLVLCQNSYALRKFAGLGGKCRLALPPMELAPSVFSDDTPIELPAGFPKKVMGYIGSFFHDSFDFALWERFMEELPGWGFILMGRTDAAGEAAVEKLRRHPGFLRLPWQPRSRLGPVWRLLDVSLLLYSRYELQEGAFATKALESAFFGVPCMGTEVPKTEDMAPYFPRGNEAALAVGAAAMGEAKVREAFEHFAYEMDPRLHLARAAECLQG